MVAIVVVLAVVSLLLLTVAAVGRTAGKAGRPPGEKLTGNAAYRNGQFWTLIVLGVIGLIALVIWGIASIT